MTTVPLEAFQRERTRRIELEQFIKWEDELFENAELSTSQRLITRATRRAVLEGKPREDGLTYVSMEKIAGRAGVSVSTARRGQQYLADLGVIHRKVEDTPNDEGEQRTHVFIKLTDAINTPSKIIPAQPRNHGGRRERCPSCGSEHLKLVQRVICCDCGTVVKQQEKMLQPDTPDGTVDDSPPESQAPSNQVNVPSEQVDRPDPAEQVDAQDTPLCVNLTDMVFLESNVTHKEDSQKPASPPTPCVDPIRDAAQLLLEIAGPSPEHVEMSRKGPAKYYTIHCPLTLNDMIAHLQGKKTVGALLCHPHGKTRALCYDVDEEQGWQHLQEAALLLPYGDYCPILEVSPAGRGGHLWVIYTDLVDARSAHRHLLQFAPMLSQIVESWPGSGSNKVRLPGGRYESPTVSAWCQLIDGRGKLLAPEGHAAQLLLDSQVSADLVPEYPPEPPPGAREHPHVQEKAFLIQCAHQAEHDQEWQAKYHHTWFHFTPAQLAAWYNARHDIRAILPPQKNHMGLATWRGERTASVGYTRDGEGWVDFGASALRSDGKRDGGDALELQARVMHMSKVEVMRQAARDLLAEARPLLEHAAREHEQPPEWVQQIMTPQGWSYYWKVRKGVPVKQAAATMGDQHGGLAGCSARSGIDQACTGQDTQRGEPTHPTAAVLMHERHLTHGHACETCGCELYRPLAEYTVCVRCYPSRSYDEYSDQIDMLYPRKRREILAWKKEAHA